MNRLHQLRSLLPSFRCTRHFSAIGDRTTLNQLKQVDRRVFVDRTCMEGVAVLAMNFQQKKNALSKVFVEDMSAALTELEKDDKSRVVIICSLVPNVFCAGADLRERAAVPDADVPKLVGGLRALFHRVYSLPHPVIGAIDGAALGGGFELALACDVLFAGNLPRSQLGLIETHWALLPGAGGSQRLPRLIGPGKAKELMFAARRMTAPEAAAVGAVNMSVEPSAVPEEWRDMPAFYQAMLYASELCTKGPIALRLLKRAVNEGLESGSLERGLEIEGACYKQLVPTKDRKEGMAAFIEKRQPIYHGH